MVQAIQLKAISSMATKAVLADLTKLYFDQTGISVMVESAGGIDVAKRIQNGENFDLVLLGRDAIDRLVSSGHLIPTTCQDWVLSLVGIAIKAGTSSLPISNAEDIKNAVLASPRISYSTGPSGVYLEKLFAQWGISKQIETSLIVPPPGTPIGSLIAQGKVDLGFQQMSELLPIQGIKILGTLPEDIAYITTFSAAIPGVIEKATRSDNRKLLRFMDFIASAQVDAIKEKHGMSGVR
jgi:molybdate transport system substrate-binding protein